MGRSPRTLPAHRWPRSMTRVIAVDWSGARTGAKSRIWLAEICSGRLTRLESGRDRDELIAYLIEVACTDPDLVVGLDFAFSFPRWFAEGEGATSIEEVWDLVSKEGEQWLSDCKPPFWGRRGKPRPDLREHYRRTERCAAETKDVNPKSVFQIGGAGAVGTGSIRGMPYLAKLAEAGFSIWPFHGAQPRPPLEAEPRQTPLVIEIYPRLLTGPVTKSDFCKRRAHLTDNCLPEIGGGLACKAASSEDAFDAAVSAVEMSRHLDEIVALSQSQDPVERIEGAIWWPQEPRVAVTASRRAVHQQTDCPFCVNSREDVIHESRHAVAIRDRYPVSRGHVLVVPEAHVKSLFDLSTEAQADVWHLVAKVRSDLQSKHHPDGFNIGINDGRAAGQTVEHAHVHVIPRFDGDAADPRGGVRWVLPECAAYWDQ